MNPTRSAKRIVTSRRSATACSRAAGAGAAVSSAPHEPQFAIAADERRLEPLGLQRSARPGHNSQRSEERVEPAFALQLVRTRVLVGNRLLGRTPRRLAGVDRTWWRDRLDPRSGVDEVAGDHPLALGAECDRGLARQNAGASAELGASDLVPQGRHGGDEIKGRADGTLGIVLGRDGRSPDGHHRVADELLHGAAVELDQTPACVEIPREQLARVLGIALLRRRREADEIGEQDGDEATFGDRPRGWCRLRWRRRRGSCLVERGATLIAEPHCRVVGLAARRADSGERRSAAAAEPCPGGVLDPAVHTGRHR